MRLGSILLSYDDLTERISMLNSLIRGANDNQKVDNPTDDPNILLHEMDNCMDLLETYLISIALKKIKFKDITRIDTNHKCTMDELREKLLDQKVVEDDKENEFCLPTIRDVVYYNPPENPYVVRKSMIMDVKFRPYLFHLLKTGEEVVRVYRTRQDAINQTIKELESRIICHKYSLLSAQHRIDEEERLLGVLKKKI